MLHVSHSLSIAAVVLSIVLRTGTSSGLKDQSPTNHTFTIGKNCFLKDGKPFQYFSGSFHYWRTPPEYWADIFRKMRAAGLNAVQTYLIWNLHEREPAHFDFTDNLDIRKFIRTAQKYNLLVILRPGPYIDAEVDMGGLPYWLLKVNATMRLRSSDPQFLFFVERWYRKVLSLLHDMTYSNGGPIIMAQIENEYGYAGDDRFYKEFLRNLTSELLGRDVVLFTTDGIQSNVTERGSIKNTLTTVDFGTGTDVSYAFNVVERKYNPTGPLVNSEFYPGWLDMWGSPFVTVNTKSILQTMNEMLQMNASFNFYMFFGGTNFGFSAGANERPVTTSYDYDAPLSEAGDPTPKYMAIRNLLKKYTPLPYPVPPARIKATYGKVGLKYMGDLSDYLDVLAPKNPVRNDSPLSFEHLGQSGGFVLYRTILSVDYPEAAELSIRELHDRAYVFLQKKIVGVLSRLNPRQKLRISPKKGQVLDILVQNEGRICFGNLSQQKGFLNVNIAGKNVSNWMMYPINLPSFPRARPNKRFLNDTRNIFFISTESPGFYSSEFYVSKAEDTFLNMAQWGNGYAFLNGHNLGRYWPSRGPQVTLFVPGVFLSDVMLNILYIFELEKSPCLEQINCYIGFQDYPILNGTIK